MRVPTAIVFCIQKEISALHGCEDFASKHFLRILQSESAESNTLLTFLDTTLLNSTFVSVATQILWHFLRNQWKEVLSLSNKEVLLNEQVKATFPVGSAELLLIRCFCADLCGGEPFDVAFSRMLEGPLAGEIKKAIALEKAALLMSRGLYLETLAGLEGCTDLPAFWTLRRAVLEGISAQASGDFPRTQKALLVQKLEIEKIAISSLGLMWERRALGFEIEQENYREASVRLRMIENEMLHNADPVIKALFYQEGILLALAQNDREVVEEFWKLTQPIQKNISGSFVSMTEETCEASLMFQKPEQAAIRISEQIALAQRMGQFNSLCVAQFELARALALQEKFNEAAVSAELALLVAEKHHFGRDRVRVLFLLL